MRCAYPVCADTEARIFPLHPPTLAIYPLALPRVDTQKVLQTFPVTGKFFFYRAGFNLLKSSIDIAMMKEVYSAPVEVNLKARGDGCLHAVPARPRHRGGIEWWLLERKALTDEWLLRGAEREECDGRVAVCHLQKKKQLAVESHPSLSPSRPFINTNTNIPRPPSEFCLCVFFCSLL